METQIKDHKFRKFVYLAVCAVLGVLLFVFIEQTALQLLVALEIMPGATFDFVNSIAAIAALALGAWYGVWLGSHWYGKVYGQTPSGGFVTHLTTAFKQGDESKEDDAGAWQMDDLFNMPAPEVEPAVTPEAEPQKKIVTKRARAAKPKKVNTPKISSTTTKRTPPAVPIKKRATRKKVTAS